RLIEKVVELDADGVLISTIVTHSDVHKGHMQQLHRLAVERGLREELLLVSGGTQVSDQLARECGLDAGFGRGTRGQEVANFLVRKLRQRDSSR
ncbi:MAG: LuxR family transcriptional regulator, partial [Candidatus Sedimenticola sp. (ex Thyasira tokunagai)]